MSGPAECDAPLVMRLRALLSAQAPGCLTYQQLAKTLGLVPPGTIGQITAALEHMMHEDVAAGRPMIAALVVSRTDGLPRRGFFDLAVRLGRFPADQERHIAMWQAECAALMADKGPG